MSLSKLFNHIKASPTAAHVAERVKNILEENGYCNIDDEGNHPLARGGRFYTRSGMSGIVAFRLPDLDEEPPPSGLMIVAAHGDSPSFAITPSGNMTVGDYVRLTVEKYGGMLCATWFDRPLSVAGTICVREANGVITQRLVNVDRDLVVIPSVAIHMNRNANDKASYNPAVDMQPLFGTAKSDVTLDTLLAEAAGVKPSDILARQVCLYVRQDPIRFGAEREFIGSPRLDDQECVYASLEAFLQAKQADSIPMFVLFDHEEIGSATREGADSGMLSSLVDRICEALDMTTAEKMMLLASSLMVSADNAHAKHPNHPEYADQNNAPKMNGGVVLKYNANRRYATDAIAAALFTEICNRARVPLQNYTNRPDLPGGSTLGSISMTHLSVPTVDIGLAQLAMHSAFETAGAKDYDYMVKALTAVYSSSIARFVDGSYHIS